MSLESKVRLMEKAIQNYESSFADSDHDKLVKQDVRDLRKVLSLMKESKFDEAWKTASSLDTAVREAIPDKIYYFLQDF